MQSQKEAKSTCVLLEIPGSFGLPGYNVAVKDSLYSETRKEIKEDLNQGCMGRKSLRPWVNTRRAARFDLMGGYMKLFP
ncbi:hypothetical protein AVEN_109365-1 [Araneus ventricosus]|uniref:Uncharacterized protein n=1 Tax=Araneus ventricosus TaxID=182803 RepID=A0A4Y2U4W7_ARAVE|nr:hypothetical protein AVEN_109365-1 [Araneus ventricosus]